MKWLVVILGLATGLIHAFIGISGVASVPAETTDWMLLANGVGYLVLTMVYARAIGNRSTIRWIFIAYALITIIGYFVVWGADGLSNTIGLVVKGIELLLIIALILDRRNDVVPASQAKPATAASTADRSVEVALDAPATETAAAVEDAGASAVAAKATAASVVAAATDEAAGEEADADVRSTAAVAAVDESMTEESDDKTDAAVAAIEEGVDAPADTAERIKDFFNDDETAEEATERLRAYIDSFGSGSEFNKEIEFIETIGVARGEKLRAAGVERVGNLLILGATRKGRKELAEATELTESQILTWVNQADLYRIKGVAKQYADLLERSGVDTVIELAHRNPGNLYQKMTEVNEASELVNRLPNASAVESWVAQAKELPRVIYY